MLTCRELIDFIDSYLDDELEPPVRERFDAHLELCPSCVTYLESYRRTIALAGEAFEPCGPEDAVPEEVPEEMVQAVLAARRRS